VAVKIHWIKAHQDNNGKVEEKLTLSAEMIITVDAMASNFLQRCISIATGGPRQRMPHFPTMQASLLIEDKRIHKNPQNICGSTSN
jgi:hypothetical protein